MATSTWDMLCIFLLELWRVMLIDPSATASHASVSAKLDGASTCLTDPTPEEGGGQQLYRGVRHIQVSEHCKKLTWGRMFV